MGAVAIAYATLVPVVVDAVAAWICDDASAQFDKKLTVIQALLVELRCFNNPEVVSAQN